MHFDLLDIAVFVRAAALGNLSAAARDLALSTSTASARLQRLEEQLGARLLHRTTRRLSLTGDGERFLVHAEQLLVISEAAAQSVGRGAEAPRGPLRVTAPASFGRQHVSPAIPAFLKAYPDITLDLRLTDQIVGLVDAGIDVALRMGALPDSSLVARPLAPSRRVICASPDYLGRHGTPRHPEDLRKHNCLVLGDQSTWRFDTPVGEHAVAVHGNLRVDNGEVIRDAILAGMGIALKSTWDVAPYLQRGDLVSLLDEYPVLPAVSIWAVYPSRHLVPAKTRAFVDFFADWFGSPPYWDRGHPSTPPQIAHTA
ncbi:MAG: LysR family transcriptional regulator [Cupriavidus sp.]|jgi:DNA-binding transcriptional LysR family regulator|uniref:LysR family transcriptional regulator n=1 Tax=Cupriavidus pauculus TaxID=82633 RepID=UPI000C39D5A2|nr:LysR family transcriptional regulator [Cupriavidus pauculus]KAB0604689.1 LysR family transcriptional regulator [Cupriavidus pauculus]MBU68144.1 LysR family transcriptional regulator [Cupriavidus sp.]MCM3607120.1 LysR family transcriptional regulator [Cupriavidus pauculus]UAK98876.1 LysR family transcriptional regulator [Cupriavidus pauculus]